MYEVRGDAAVAKHQTNHGFRWTVKILKYIFSPHEIHISLHRNLPAKAITETKRRKDRDAAKEKAKEFLRGGKTDDAKKEFTKAVDITHQDAVAVMRECRKLGVDCITAMYEADSQLAYLNKIGVAHYVISEDSDLILFGCSKIIFKLQLDGRCLLFEADKLYQVMGVTEDKYSFDKFRRACILSGCDYLNSLHGIGLAKAKKFVLMTEETDMSRAIPKLPTYLNMKKLTITDEYIDGFQKAEATFKHMFVYDPLRREMKRLNDIDDDDPELEYCTNAGEILQPAAAYQLALGNLNPRSLQRVDDFDPDKSMPIKRKVLEKYPSIWSRSSGTSTVSMSLNFKQVTISNFFVNPPQKHKQLAEVQNIIEQENDVTSEIEIDDLLTSYCVTETFTAKRRSSHIDQEEVKEVVKPFTPSRNPFAKRHQPEPLETVAPSSLLNSLKQSLEGLNNIVKQDEPRVVSRFFVRTKTSVETDCSSEPSSCESNPEIEKLNFLRQQKDLQHQKYYETLRRASVGTSGDEGSSEQMNESQEELNEEICPQDTQSQPASQEFLSQIECQDDNIVDLEKYEFKLKPQRQTFISDIKPKVILKSTKSKGRGLGLSKPKATASQKSDDSSIQTKLSKFGFQKQQKLSQE